MRRQPDEKLRIIRDSVVGRGCSPQELRELGHAGDLITCAEGETFHSELDANRWAYLLLDGHVALSQQGDPLAVASRGSWFPLRPADRSAYRAHTSLTALRDSQLLVFRWSDVGGVLELPAMTAASR